MKVPKGFYLLGPKTGYACSSVVVVPPSVFLSADERRKTRAMSELGFTPIHMCAIYALKFHTAIVLQFSSNVFSNQYLL